MAFSAAGPPFVSWALKHCPWSTIQRSNAKKRCTIVPLVVTTWDVPVKVSGYRWNVRKDIEEKTLPAAKT